MAPQEPLSNVVRKRAAQNMKEARLLQDRELPNQVNPNLKELLRPHVDSFDYFLEEGLQECVRNLLPEEFEYGTELEKHRLRFSIENVEIGLPRKEDDSLDIRLLPHECRERGLTYAAQMTATFILQHDDYPEQEIERKIGYFPMMVMSKKCHLESMSPTELAANGEEASELGGYFISNGIERCIRLLIVPRRNYPMAVRRSAFANRGPEYTEYGVSMRCVRDDESGQTISLHYLKDGSCVVRVSIRKNEFLIPLVRFGVVFPTDTVLATSQALLLKSLLNISDREIYEACVSLDPTNSFLSGCVEAMLLDGKKYSFATREDFVGHLGSKFRVILRVPESMTDIEAGDELLRRHFFVHLGTNREKFDTIVLMVQKLYAFAHGDIVDDNPDALSSHEVLLSGHLMQMIFKEKLQEYLQGAKSIMIRDARIEPHKVVKDGKAVEYFKRCLEKNPINLTKKMEYFLATGNLRSESGLDLMQVSGYTVVAEKLNFLRYISHFRSIHRGQFFAEMKTTAVRKLLPESFGFLCPVHTPDGSPCGLLNHFAKECKIMPAPHNTSVGKQFNPADQKDEICEIDFSNTLYRLGVLPLHPQIFPSQKVRRLPVMLNGKFVGFVREDGISEMAEKIRLLKVLRQESVPSTTEVVCVLPNGGTSGVIGLFPGLFLFTTPARMLRSVIHLRTGRMELIGTFEQLYLNIAIRREDVRRGITTHMEFNPMNMLSLVASMTPFSDFNQSPRNMYQCQMGKQTMGTPCHSYKHRTDNKLYRIQTPQRPIVRTRAIDDYNTDEFPTGTNAIVAVITYTGYDMEDAMIINKASYERGFKHGTVYTTQMIDLAEKRSSGAKDQRFSNKGADGSVICDSLDEDGLPFVGQRVTQGEPLYCVVDKVTGRANITRHKSSEPAYIEEVRVMDPGGVSGIGGSGTSGPLQRVSIKLRYNRNPVIGDKFSSRHGQKGVMSQLWPAADMPFTESGMVPDIMFNPHGFPSRMTIGMLIESMAGKAGAMHGMFQDATPFQFSEQNTAVDFFGQQLVKAGYHYYGAESMYSGILGVEFKVQIFIGCVYYQRLRHMVSDKFQVRSMGPVNAYTRQPVKGRKMGGGIRLGEMERDALLAHGVSYLLHDRLMNSSDGHKMVVCRKCGQLISSMVMPPRRSDATRAPRAYCIYCKTGEHCVVLRLPYVFRYLSSELAAMNIRISLGLEGLLEN